VSKGKKKGARLKSEQPATDARQRDKGDEGPAEKGKKRRPVEPDIGDSGGKSKVPCDA